MLSLSSEQQAALGRPEIMRRVFVRIDALEENGTTPRPMGFWDDSGDVTVSGRLYYGGNITQVGTLVAVDDLTIPGMTVTLSQIADEANLLVRGSIIAQRPAEIDYAIFDTDTHEVIGNLIPFFRGVVDDVVINTPQAGGEGSILLTMESVSRALTIERFETRSHESEIERDEDDEFYSYTGVQRKPIPFGQK